MNRLLWIFVELVVLSAASPALIALSRALLPVVVVVGAVLVALRAVWFFTNRW